MPNNNKDNTMNIIRIAYLIGTTPEEICSDIMTESNQMWRSVGYCGDELRVGPGMLKVLRDAKQFFNQFDEAKDGVIGMAHGVIRVYLDDSMDDNTCIISYKDTGIKLIRRT
jgi:hypothetical protein